MVQWEAVDRSEAYLSVPGQTPKSGAQPGRPLFPREQTRLAGSVRSQKCQNRKSESLDRAGLLSFPARGERCSSA